MGLLHAAAILAFAMLGEAQTQPQEAAAPEQAKGSQPNARYELGWRVRQLERAWAANVDVEKRKLALPHIEAAVQHFFGLRVPFHDSTPTGARNRLRKRVLEQDTRSPVPCSVVSCTRHKAPRST